MVRGVGARSVRSVVREGRIGGIDTQSRQKVERWLKDHFAEVNSMPSCATVPPLTSSTYWMSLPPGIGVSSSGMTGTWPSALSTWPRCETMPPGKD